MAGSAVFTTCWWRVAPDAETSAQTPPQGTVGSTATAGTVRVDVHLRNAPRGTTATESATGAAMVTPPNIQTSMPPAH